MALAVAALLGLSGNNATALSLGRITVQSALGEPLRAEIDIPEINSDEEATLRTGIASPDAFKAAGLEYNAAISSLKTTLQKRADGRTYIRLTSDDAINDPFVDMILEANWGTGRIVRDYTLLLDPPNLKKADTSPTPAQVPVAVSQTTPQAAPRPTPASPAVADEPVAARPVAVPKPAPKSAPPSDPAPAPSQSEEQVKVKRGDTASKIALANKPANVSLDQMLVAMLRNNPQAFSRGNVNRVKAGAIMSIPTAEEASATPQGDARQLVIAQSKDFNEFRRKLASSVPSTSVAPANNAAAGKVEAKVDDKTANTTAADKLKLAKVATQVGEEEKVAQQRNAKEAANRAAEIAKNIEDLNKLGAASNNIAPKASQAVQATAKAVAQAAAAAKNKAAELAKAVPKLPKPEAIPAPPTAAVAPVAPAAKPSAPMAPMDVAPVAEPSFVDDLLSDPVLPASGLGLVALLGGWAVYRSRKNKYADMQESSFLDSPSADMPLHGENGGRSVDTKSGALSGASMMYSPSQLDSADDVDPLAEADVYLAYGRDAQAEEILRAALKDNPTRLGIHQRIASICAKRNDLRGLESIAAQAFEICNGEGPEWAQIAELGAQLNPKGSLFNSGDTPSQIAALSATTATLPGAPASADVAPGNAQNSAAPGKPATNLGLDLDLSDSDEAAMGEAASASQPVQQTPPHRPDLSNAADTQDAPDSDTGTPNAPSEPTNLDASELDIPQEAPPSNDDEVAKARATLDEIMQIPPRETFSPTQHAYMETVQGDPDESFKRQAAQSFGATTPAELDNEDKPPPANDLDMLEFNLGDLSLDLNAEGKAEGAGGEQASAPMLPDDPLSTKLALAEEFIAIGDEDGARALIDEVMAEASGDVKAQAEKALASLS